MPADRVGGCVDGGGCELFQLEDGHGNPQSETIPSCMGVSGSARRSNG
jgi:hypothetical protein